MEIVHKETQQGSVVAQFRCSSVVICLDVSPQLDYMVCECNDGMLQLWSLQTGRLVWARPVVVKKSSKRSGFSYVCRNVPSVDTMSFFRSVVFHPRKECILPGILSQAYDMDGDLKSLFQGSNCRFSVCSISGDKTKILTNCLESSRCLVLWSLESGSEVDRILEDEDILSFAWSGDGRLLAVSHSSRVISLYDVMCNFRKLAQMALQDVCGMVRFSPDHRFILFCAAKGAFSYVSSCCLKVVKEANRRFPLTIVSCDSETFESFNDCGFLFGDLIAKERYSFSLTFGLNNQGLLRIRAREIELVDTRHVNKSGQGFAFPARGIAISLDGQILYVASEWSVTAYEVVSGNWVKAEMNLGGVTDIRLLCPVRGGVLILTSKSTVELWSDNLSKRINRWTNLRLVEQLMPISEERVAVVGLVDVKILDSSSGKFVSTIPVSVLQGRVVTSNSKCQLLIVRTSDVSRFLQLFDGTTVVWRKEDISILDDDMLGAFSPEERFLVVETIKSWLVLDAETGNTLRTLPTLTPGFVTFAGLCTFISDDSCVIYSDLSSSVELLNVTSGECLSAIYVEGKVSCLAACSFNHVFAIGLQDSTHNFKVVRVHLP